ncbi:cupin domain-containing protein [Amycolatopsis sp. NPDC059021]|uniref:cupin domain-containing protein n=1 Tax=Amycolatopsis sp. NPDC059021 TaxID=3346704 RepID=UPI00366D3B57
MTDPAPYAVAARTLVPDVGPQGQILATAITTELCGSRSLGVGYVAMNPRLHTHAHRHRTSDIVVTVIAGTAATVYGEQLEHVAIHSPGDSIFIPAGVLHAAINLSDEEVHAVETRTDPHFHDDDVELVPDLDSTVSAVAARIQADHEAGLLRSRHDAA